MKPYKKESSDKEYELLLHSSAHSRLDYAAAEEPSASADSLRKHYIGVYDPVTHELQLAEAHRLVLRSTLRPTEKELEDAEAQTPRRTFASLRQSLGMEFGTKKAKRAIAAMTENAISPRKSAADGDQGVPDARTSAVLESIATSGMLSREDMQAEVDEAKPRPKPNLEASTPADVYPLDTLITREERMALQVNDWIQAVAANQAIETPSRFVANRVEALASKKEIAVKLRALKYILALVSFNAALKPTRSGGRKLPPREDLKKKLSHLPPTLVESIKRKFAAGGELTKWHVDKMMTHAAALALYVDDYEVDTFDLREDLRLESKAMHQYFRELGASVAGPTERERERLKIGKLEAGLHFIAKLKLPLEFPRQRIVAAKRR